MCGWPSQGRQDEHHCDQSERVVAPAAGTTYVIREPDHNDEATAVRQVWHAPPERAALTPEDLHDRRLDLVLEGVDTARQGGHQCCGPTRYRASPSRGMLDSRM
jgi:hypothetical protein